MTRTINVGVIGCGLMGREFAGVVARWIHLHEIGVTPRIVAACDTTPAMLAWFQHAVPTLELATDDYHALLAHPGLDAVYCAVPHNLHAQVYCDILAAGKHLLGEKPFGIDVAANAQINTAIAAHPDLLVRCSSEFPFFPGAQRIVQLLQSGALGRIIDARVGFLHSSDLDPNKPINWKRRIATNGAYGCMGDLGMHTLHIPLRAGWQIRDLRALLSKIVAQRPDASGAMHACETWDNALLACTAEANGESFPLLIETRRIAPGETNTWYIRVEGTRAAAEFSTRYPKTFRLLEYTPGGTQAWQEHSIGATSVYPTQTGPIFEFGFSDSLLQMWAAFFDELAHGTQMRGNFGCMTPAEVMTGHQIFTAALASHANRSVEIL